jgi:glutaredoxin
MITIYGKKGCAKCKAAMDKLNLLGLTWQYVDVSAIGIHREHPLAVDAMADSANRNEQWPILLIGEVWMDYPEAMKFFKGQNNA